MPTPFPEMAPLSLGATPLTAPTMPIQPVQSPLLAAAALFKEAQRKHRGAQTEVKKGLLRAAALRDVQQGQGAGGGILTAASAIANALMANAAAEKMGPEAEAASNMVGTLPPELLFGSMLSPRGAPSYIAQGTPMTNPWGYGGTGGQ